jgi:hypothetical protein
MINPFFIKNSAQTLEKFSLLMMLNNATQAKELAKISSDLSLQVKNAIYEHGITTD